MKELKMIITTVSLLAFPVYSNIDIDSDLMDKYLREGIQTAIKNQLEAKGFKVADAKEKAIERGCDFKETVIKSVDKETGTSTTETTSRAVNCDPPKKKKK